LRIGELAAAAFHSSLSQDIFPPCLHHKSETGDPFQDEVQWRSRRNIRRMREGKPTFVVVDVPENGDGTEEVLGYAQWDPPTKASPEPAPSEADQDPAPGSLDEEALREMWRVIDDETKKALGPDGHSKMWCKYQILGPRYGSFDRGN
jgi:thiamine pyrophosphate-dependent acetolactate synthase large subunit-like protein